MENLETKINNMKNQTIGVEIEMNNISREKAAKIVADYFNSRVGYTGGCYDTYTSGDRKGRTWRFVTDASIQGPRSEQCEMVTPILTYDDIEDLQNIVRLLRAAGAKSDYTRNCGVHIHIGAAGHTPATMRNLTNIMASHELLLVDALAINRSRLSRWCRPVDPRFLEAVNKKKPTTMAKFADVWYQSQGEDWGRNEHYNGSRYHILNFHATFTKGTIEFRLFQFDAPDGTKKNGLHAGQLKAYIQLCLALSNQAKETKFASFKPQQNENPKYAMRTWLLRLGFIGDEFKTAREVLTNRLKGDASFRSGVRPTPATEMAAQ